MNVSINCDIGESFGIYSFGDDSKIMPLITDANIACGFHASDPNHIKASVSLAKQNNVNIGAHFSYPDLQGFGRREMKMTRDELVNTIIYQIGALKAFLDIEELELKHLKPHGALYTVAALEEDVVNAISDVAEYFKLPVFGLSNTLHEKVYKQRGVKMIAEVFVDIDYDKNGSLILSRSVKAISPEKVVNRALKAIQHGVIETIEGTEIALKAETICIHSDCTNVLEILLALNKELKDRNLLTKK